VNDNGSTDVLIGGSSLVSGSLARQLTVSGATAVDQVSSTPVTLNWADTGQPVNATSGDAGGLLNALNSTIPSYLTQLDGVAAQLVTSVNTQQAAGYDLTGAAGGPFFDPAKTTAAGITVVLTDPDGVAASANAPTIDANGNPVVSLDGSNAQKLANFSGTGADAAYRQLVVRLGSESQSAQQKTTTQQSVVQQIQASRDSAAGVDLDEEQTNLITYQQAYNAAAKFLSVLDGVLDTLINHTLV
jgi:flagellar hook-associated protein 1 FlgK